MIIKNKRTTGKINAHFGIKDYFKYFKSIYSELNIEYSKYKNIIADFNSEIVNLIIEENLEYHIPHLGSTLSIKKDKRVPKLVNGKLYNTVPVDWVATNKLWSEDNEAKEKKLLVRYTNEHSSKYVFRIYYKKYVYPFMNKRIYNFKSNRRFQRLLSSRIKDETKDKYEAFLLFGL